MAILSSGNSVPSSIVSKKPPQAVEAVQYDGTASSAQQITSILPGGKFVMPTVATLVINAALSAPVNPGDYVVVETDAQGNQAASVYSATDFAAKYAIS